jgi:tRNA C32,U32 (ribose-2'-O)-methylase TrmJ
MTIKQSKKANGKQVDIKIESAPDDFKEPMQQIESYIKKDKLAEAQKVLSNLLEKHGENRALLLMVPLVKICLKDCEGAYQATLALTEEERSSSQIRNIIQSAIILVDFKAYSTEAETDVMSLLEDKLITDDEFYRVAQQLVAFKLGFGEEQVDLDLEKLKSDSLFLKVLTRSHIRSASLAQAVSIIRNNLLTLSLTEMQLPDHLVGLAQALAIQAMNKDYAHEETDGETEMIAELQIMLEQVVSNDDFHPLQVEGLFLLLCMYRRLYDLPIKERLLQLPKDVWPESLTNLVDLNLYKLAE